MPPAAKAAIKALLKKEDLINNSWRFIEGAGLSLVYKNSVSQVHS